MTLRSDPHFFGQRIPDPNSDQIVGVKDIYIIFMYEFSLVSLNIVCANRKENDKATTLSQNTWSILMINKLKYSEQLLANI